MAAKQRAPGWWYPWIFVAGMAVVVAVNAVMITMALKTFPGLETTDAYQKGLAYNRTLAEAREQEARGWTSQIVFAPGGPQKGDLKFTLRDSQGQPLDGFAVEASLVRPTVGGHDFAVTLAPQGSGVYVAPVAFPLAGRWTVVIAATRGEETYQETQKIFAQ